MDWARKQAHVAFTHDLDFGILLALTRADGPSVVQLRTPDVMPREIGAGVVGTLQKCQAALERGALVTIDEEKERVRVLPFR